MTESKYGELIDKAKGARENAYAPYSGLKVGAAALTSSGEIFTGCNVENASYGAAICAERAAACAAVCAGQNKIEAVAVASDKLIFPCGICRQFLSEFIDEVNEDIIIICADDAGQSVTKTLRQLAPHGFDKSNVLGKKD